MATTVTIAAAVKDRFYLDKNTIPDMTYEESPAYAELAKSEDWAGDTAYFPLILGNNQSGSSQIATAQANAGALKTVRWGLPSKDNRKHYVIAKIPGDVIRMMESRANAYWGAVESEVESALKAGARRYSINLFREGWGDIGEILSVSTTTVTLKRKEDAKNFEVDMKCQASQSQSGHVLRDSGTERLVSAVDEDAGTVTFSTDVAAAGWAANDFIFTSGDRESSATPTRRVATGFEAWVPYDRTKVTSTAFFGVDRSVNKTRLAGSYLDGSSMSIREAILEMVGTLAGRKAKPDRAYLSFSQWTNLAKELGSAVVYNDIKVGESGNVGFRAITITGPKGAVQVLPDVGCPMNRCFVIQKNTWKLLSLGRPIGFLDEDENQMLRLAAEDTYEIRIGGYTELLCMAPGFNGVINLAT